LKDPTYDRSFLVIDPAFDVLVDAVFRRMILGDPVTENRFDILRDRQLNY
jgi:hypothetical protein